MTSLNTIKYFGKTPTAINFLSDRTAKQGAYGVSLAAGCVGPKNLDQFLGNRAHDEMRMGIERR